MEKKMKKKNLNELMTIQKLKKKKKSWLVEELF